MKKSGKLLFTGVILLMGILTIPVFAGQYWLYLKIPRAQLWDYTDDDCGNGEVSGSSSNHANIDITGFTGISAVTFYAGAFAKNGKDVTWAESGSYIYRSDFENGENEVSVPYDYTYGKGQKMGLKARNHNWSLNTGEVSGTVDYH